MVQFIVTLTLAVSAHAAPAAPSFELSLAQLRHEVLAARASFAEADLKKADQNVRLTANQCWQTRNALMSLRAQAQSQQPGLPDAALQGQLLNLISNLQVTAQNAEVVSKQVAALAASVAKDPALASLAQKLYADSRQLDSEAGYLAIEARNDAVAFGMAGCGAQGYQIQNLSSYIAERTPGVRENAKKVLDGIQ